MVIDLLDLCNTPPLKKDCQEFAVTLNCLNLCYKEYFYMTASFMVQSILGLMNAFPEERQFRDRQIKKPTDTKIKRLVLEQIAVGRKTGALFPSATSPNVVIGLLSSLHLPKKSKEERNSLNSTRRLLPRRSILESPSKGIPIGLHRYDPCHWLNSLIQFLLFLPGSWELFSLVPRSFQPLREFADQYLADQEAGVLVSSAHSSELFLSLIPKLSLSFLHGKPILYDLLSEWMMAMFPYCPFTLPGEIHPVLLHPEWHLVADDLDFEEALQNKMGERAPELLIRFKGEPFPLKGRYFAFSDASASYDLDAFIEMRLDGANGENYIAYLKREGAWYQCDDDRVIQFRTNCLNAPLRRATLLHYKRMELTGGSRTFFKK